MELTSSAFKDGERLPKKYTCEGQDVSPPLAWAKPPDGVKTFSLILDDPDAPGRVFTHWVLFNMPAGTQDLPEGVPMQSSLASGALHGKNDMGKLGYGGPCPPPGKVHHYNFNLYALDNALDLRPGATKKQVLEAMERHILAEARLIGTYSR